MQVVIIELTVNIESTEKARELKEHYLHMYEEFGLEGIKAMREDANSMAGKFYTNKYRKLKKA